MSRRAGRCWLPLVGTVIAAPSWAGRAEAERVILCEPRVEICARAQRLGAAPPRGWTAAIGDGPLHEAARAAKIMPVLLYPSREAYEDAVGGLSDQERQRAVRRRLEVVSGAATTVPGFLFETIRNDLLAVIAVAGPRDDVVVEDALRVAVALAGGAARFAVLTPRQVVDQARDSLAKVLAELTDSPAASSYTKESSLLAEIQTALTHQPAPPAPFASPVRAYFAPRERPPARRDPLFVDQPWYAWRGGTVVTLRPQEAAEPPRRTGGLRPMYFDRETFLRDIDSLTDAQMNLRLAARLPGPPPQELAALIARLALEHAVFIRQCATPMRALDSQAAHLWARTVTLSTENLRLVAAAGTKPAKAGLADRVARLREDVALATALTRAGQSSASNAAVVDQIQAAVDRMKERELGR